MEWWKKSVVYQVYIQSFQDSNHDGIGDFQGLISRLDYLKTLGIDVIWVTPFYQSPLDDNGYDISDYRKILDRYGTMDDFQEFVEEVHLRHMKVIIDLVFNHTSDEHMWFIESQKSKDNAYHDYYIWHDPKNHNVPNNWTSCFQGSAWQYHKELNQYYLHLFSKKQPDLNWQNKKVREECYDIMKYWLERGVDGFRLDVINIISKDESQYVVDTELKGHRVCANGPHIHEYLQEMNKEVFSHYDLLTVGETPLVTPQDANQYASLDGKELSMVFQFELMNVDGGEDNKWTDRRYKVKDFKDIMTRWQTGMYNKGWNSLFLNNHDQPRCVSRFGDTSSKEYHEKSAKMLAILLHMMQGTPYIYQGEEIGMTNANFTNLTQYKDIDSLNAYHQLVEVEKTVSHEDMIRYLRKSSRDHARTPMQWDNTSHAGFSHHAPWIEVNPNYKDINVQASLDNPDSIFYTYQKLIKLRKKYDIIIEGKYELLLNEDENIYAYRRIYKDKELVVIGNMTSFDCQYDTSLVKQEHQVLISNYKNHHLGHLRPYEAIVFYQKYVNSQ